MKEKLNIILKDVIEEARALNIPVPDNICEEIKVNGRPKKRFGCCRRENGVFTIEVSKFLIDRIGCENFKVRQVIAHEVLHTCDGCYEHGVKWKEYAKKMNSVYGYNIKRTSTFEEMGIDDIKEQNRGKIKYIIKCSRCGREYPRQRFTCVMKKINAYRCNCGGRLEIIEVK